MAKLSKRQQAIRAKLTAGSDGKRLDTLSVPFVRR